MLENGTPLLPPASSGVEWSGGEGVECHCLYRLEELTLKVIWRTSSILSAIMPLAAKKSTWGRERRVAVMSQLASNLTLTV